MHIFSKFINNGRMKIVQLPINIIPVFILKKNQNKKTTNKLLIWNPVRVLINITTPVCVYYANGLLESNFSFKINCTQADFQRLIGNRDRTHTSYAGKPTID